MNNRFIVIIILMLIGSNGIAQEYQKVKDSLFFQLDKDILIQNEYEPEYFFLKSNSTSTFAFLVQKKDIKIDIQKNRVSSFKNFLRVNFNTDSKIKSSDLLFHLKKYKIFLIQCNKEIMEVLPITLEE